MAGAAKPMPKPTMDTECSGSSRRNKVQVPPAARAACTALRDDGKCSGGAGKTNLSTTAPMYVFCMFVMYQGEKKEFHDTQAAIHANRQQDKRAMHSK
jgi:hypothetical protein